MRIQSSPARFTADHPGTAKTSNPHSQWAAHRGFVPRGLSDAKRHPKLFTIAEWHLFGRAWSEADIHSRIAAREISPHFGHSRGTKSKGRKLAQVDRGEML